MSRYLFTLPIGDWSDDGHGECDYYHIESNKPVEEVREAHFKIRDVTGIDIHEIANEYEVSYFDDEHPVIEYINNKINASKSLKECAQECSMTSKTMAELWVLLLQDADPTLELKMVEQNKVPMLSFYGFDKKGRHISFVGYGTF